MDRAAPAGRGRPFLFTTVKRDLVWSASAIACSALLRTWLGSTGDLRLYLQAVMPPGQLLYVLSKLAGLLALCGLMLQLLLVLMARGSTASPRRHRRFHRRFGLTLCALVAVHIACFALAVRLRTGDVPLELLFPALGHGYYRTRISLGALSLWCLCLGVCVRALRASHGSSKLHRLAPLSLLLALPHGFAIGTETRNGAAVAVFGVASVLIGGLWAYQMVLRRSAGGLK